MPTPSLLIVPARFKSGKLYSQIPTSGAGDFTVTRATSATRVNASGLIESVASGIPRLDYFASGGTVGCPALLVEPAATNLALRSEEFNDASIFKQGSSVSADTTTAPDGTLTADTFSDASGAGTHFMRLTNIAAVSGTTYSISMFVKAGTSKRIELSLRANNASDIGFGSTVFDLASGVIVSGTGSIIPFANNWYRCTSVGTVNASGTSNVFCWLYNSADQRSYTGTSGTNNVFVWGAQVETGSIATSYIPTTTGSVTRNADVISVSGAVSGSIGQTGGVFYIDLTYSFKGSSSPNRWLQLFGASNNIGLAISPTNVIRSIVNGQSDILPLAPETTGAIKIAWAYDNTGTVFFINGTKITLANGGGQTMSSLTSLTISGSDNPQLANARIRALALYNTRLTDGELATLTTP